MSICGSSQNTHSRLACIFDNFMMHSMTSDCTSKYDVVPIKDLKVSNVMFSSATISLKLSPADLNHSEPFQD